MLGKASFTWNNVQNLGQNQFPTLNEEFNYRSGGLFKRKIAFISKQQYNMKKINL